MDYLSVAKNIFDYLAQFQISERRCVAKVEHDKLKIKIEHPIENKIEALEPLPKNDYFRFHGIGLKILEKSASQAILDVYDFGGIFDPIDYLVPGEHYATTHFALLGAILFREQNDVDVLQKVKHAIDFHLKTSRDEYRFGSWMYHWDFQNYALMETYLLLEQDLSPDEKDRWERGLKNWKQNTNNGLTNWIVMRAYADVLRYQRFHSLSDKLQYWWRLHRLEKAWQADGCYDDYPNSSRPIQYHVFTLALLHRIFLLTNSNRLKKKILDGVNFFIKFIDPDGSFNYLGRGQEQIFGYAVGLYILEAAKQLDGANKQSYQNHIEKMWKHLLSFERDGTFPLVLNCHPDEKKYGWYDYHHVTVYNAFLGVWLGLTHLLTKHKSDAPITEPIEVPSPSFCFFEPTKNIIFSNNEYFAVFSAGTSEYLSEPGITPLHLWFKNVGWLFSCPGGPTPEKFGKIHKIEHIEKNLLAPIARDDNSAWLLPAFKESQIVTATPELVVLKFDYGAFVLKRLISFHEKAIIFEDRFQFVEDGNLEELRYFNFPIVTEKFKIEIEGALGITLVSDKGTVKVIINDSDFGADEFEKLETIKTAKGLAQVVSLRKLNYPIRKRQENYLGFSINRISANSKQS